MNLFEEKHWSTKHLDVSFYLSESAGDEWPQTENTLYKI